MRPFCTLFVNDAAAPLFLSLLVGLLCAGYILAHRDLFRPLPKGYSPPPQHHHPHHLKQLTAQGPEVEPLLPLSSDQQVFGRVAPPTQLRTGSAGPVAEGAEIDVGVMGVPTPRHSQVGHSVGLSTGQRQGSLATAASLDAGGLPNCPNTPGQQSGASLSPNALPGTPPGFQFEAAPTTAAATSFTDPRSSLINPATPGQPEGGPVRVHSPGSTSSSGMTFSSGMNSTSITGAPLGKPPRHTGGPSKAAAAVPAAKSSGGQFAVPGVAGADLPRIESGLSGEESVVESSESQTSSGCQVTVCWKYASRVYF